MSQSHCAAALAVGTMLQSVCQRCGGELGPGAFLGGGQLEFFFQGGLALGGKHSPNNKYKNNSYYRK